MQVTNQKLHHKLSFSDYLKLPGMSFSGIKAKLNGEVKATTKMQLGTHVHNYLLEPEKYNHDNEHHQIVGKLATEVKSVLGVLYRTLDSEIAVTATFEHQNFVLPYKGRIDLLNHGRVVIDLKVSEVPLSKSIPFFNYDKQLTGYAISTGAKAQIILRICPKTMKTELQRLPLSIDWWQAQVLKYGNPILN